MHQTQGARLKGQIQLQFVRAASPRRPDDRQCFKFDVVTPTRTFRLWAASRDEMDQWTSAINSAAERQRAMAADVATSQKMQKQKSAAPTAPPLATWERWTSEQVGAWLWTFGQQQHADAFVRAGIVGSQLKSISSGDLQHTCGVGDVGDQMQILAEVKRLLQDNLAFGTPMPSSGMMGDADEVPW